MIAAVDVHYRGDAATAACVLFEQWADEKPATEHVVRVAEVAPYEPGAFYKRELPPVLEVLRDSKAFDLVIVDGYVWLGPGRKGLGAHLHEAIGKPVIGVAKTRFHGAEALEVHRGSTRPLYVTAIGIDSAQAAEHVRAMHGPYRLPTLLKRVDQLCRAR